MEKEPRPTRVILEKQGPFIVVINEVLATIGSRGTLRTEWISAGGGGDFFDPTEEDLKILNEHGSPVIVYSDGNVELVSPSNNQA